MTDVRLTAVNPEDSQVYPVACNDKGELLLDSGGATGDLDVTGNLTVAGTGTFGSQITSGADAFATANTGSGLTSTGSVIARRSETGSVWLGYQTGTATQTSTIKADGSASFASQKFRVGASGETVIDGSASAAGSTLFDCKSAYNSGNSVASILADGSATFASDIQIPRLISGSSTANGLTLYSAGHIYASRDAANNLWVGRQTGTPGNTSTITADGAATFGDYDSANLPTTSGVRLDPNGALLVSSTKTSSSFADVVFKNKNSVDGETIAFYGNGSATFAGNVTAPNINFKLAPETVAAMPEPLIDEGFAANNEVDLLSVLMEMKLQIRDLNAFMQRSTQDDPET